MGHNVVLVPSAARYTSSDTHSTPIDTRYVTGGIFILEATQSTHADELLDVNIEVYDVLTEDWYTIASFTQVDNAQSSTFQELIKIPCGLGEKISCSWTMTLGDSGHKYTFSVSGVLK